MNLLKTVATGFFAAYVAISSYGQELGNDILYASEKLRNDIYPLVPLDSNVTKRSENELEEYCADNSRVSFLLSGNFTEKELFVINRAVEKYRNFPGVLERLEIIIQKVNIFPEGIEGLTEPNLSFEEVKKRIEKLRLNYGIFVPPEKTELNKYLDSTFYSLFIASKNSGYEISTEQANNEIGVNKFDIIYFKIPDLDVENVVGAEDVDLELVSLNFAEYVFHHELMHAIIADVNPSERRRLYDAFDELDNNGLSMIVQPLFNQSMSERMRYLSVWLAKRMTEIEYGMMTFQIDGKMEEIEINPSEKEKACEKLLEFILPFLYLEDICDGHSESIMSAVHSADVLNKKMEIVLDFLRRNSTNPQNTDETLLRR